MLLSKVVTKVALPLVLTFVSISIIRTISNEEICTESNNKECILKANQRTAPAIDVECRDEHEECEKWAMDGECDINPKYMRKSCRISCHECITVKFGVEQLFPNLDTLKIYRESIEYLEKFVYYDKSYDSIREHCINKESECSFWASHGECENNPKFMISNCPLACRACQDLDINTRCPIDNTTDAVESLKHIFDHINKTYNPTILSQPSSPNGTDAPWILSFDSLLSGSECDALIDWGKQIKYERSGNVGRVLADGSVEKQFDDSRTSKNCWCRPQCSEDPVVAPVLQRISELVQIPQVNFEQLQLLKYSPNEYYKEHHDFIPFHLYRQPGPRIMTLLLYLNNVEHGGETRFGDIVVKPKKGMGVLWHNVKVDNVYDIDQRTMHEAMNVDEGSVKYAANAWIHLREFKGPYEKGCI